MDVPSVDARLLQSRYRVTKQREAVLRALGDRKHLSAEAILQRVRRDLPAVSLGTIYRTLEILREIGLVQVFSHAGSAARYEAAFDKHHHLLCTSCRELTDIRENGIGEFAHALAEREGFREVDLALTILGQCRTCRSAQEAVETGS